MVPQCWAPDAASNVDIKSWMESGKAWFVVLVVEVVRPKQAPILPDAAAVAVPVGVHVGLQCRSGRFVIVGETRGMCFFGRYKNLFLGYKRPK